MTFQQDIPLAPLTTIGLGGPAQRFAACATEEDLREGLRKAREDGLRVHILGGGSNTVFADAGFRGLVIQAALRGLEFTPAGNRVLMRAAAGEVWDYAVQESIERGLGGLECLSGIPGLVGATPIQNVGAYGQEVADTITLVEAVERDSLHMVRFSPADCRFGYRTSRFKQEDPDRYVITAVTFSLTPGGIPSIRYPELERKVKQTIDPKTLRSGRHALLTVREAVLALRRGKSMVIDPADPESRSVGSFFTNPVVTQAEFRSVDERWKSSGGTDTIPSFPAGSLVKIPAGWLVEHAGFPKNFRKGNVGVSRNHALALVNRGGTTADLLGLAADIENSVRNRFGITLVREPVVVSP